MTPHFRAVPLKSNVSCEKVLDMTDNATAVNQPFPFGLEDLKFWVLRRKDGTVTKFNVTPAGVTTYDLTQKRDGVTGPGSAHPFSNSSPNTSYFPVGRLCKHSPKPSMTPLFEEQGVRLYVADASGLREGFRAFNYVLDCGDVLPDNITMDFKGCSLIGDPYLVEKLKGYSKFNEPTILKVDWFDRKAPPLYPEFFVEYAKEVQGDVVVACQGGHGRSGSSTVMLMMCLIPDYTPYAAVCHLRALHCARAIESKEQHTYIGEFGAFLGRENDIEKVAQVKNFKEAFLALELEGAKKYQEALKGGEVGAAIHTVNE